MRKYLPVILIFVFLSLGCTSFETIESTKVEPSEISQNFRISSSKDRTDVTAVFYARGATVDLDLPSLIELNGKEMSESKPFFLKGTDYHYNSSKFEPTLQFAFHAADGKLYRNEADLSPLEIAAEDLNLSRSQKIQIKLSREVAENETVTFSLRSADARVVSQNTNSNNANLNDTSEIYLVEDKADLDSSRTAFSIDQKQIKNFAPGKANLTIEVSKNSDLQQSTGKGGSIYFAYESQTVPVSVVR